MIEEREPYEKLTLAAIIAAVGVAIALIVFLLRLVVLAPSEYKESLSFRVFLWAFAVLAAVAALCLLTCYVLKPGFRKLTVVLHSVRVVVERPESKPPISAAVITLAAGACSVGAGAVADEWSPVWGSILSFVPVFTETTGAWLVTTAIRDGTVKLLQFSVGVVSVLIPFGVLVAGVTTMSWWSGYWDLPVAAQWLLGLAVVLTIVLAAALIVHGLVKLRAVRRQAALT